MAEMLAAECAVLVFFLLLIVLSGADAGLFMMGGFMLVFVPLLLVRDADRKVRQRKRAILMELPLLLNRLILLVNAGETVQQALIRIVESGEGQAADSGADKPEKAGPLQSELASAVKKMQNRVSFSRAMDELNRNCGVQEISVFVNALLLNYKRGGRELVSALSAMSHQMWEARKNAAKTLGEEASSKLVFPMVVIFLVVLVVVGTPAILWMK